MGGVPGPLLTSRGSRKQHSDVGISPPCTCPLLLRGYRWNMASVSAQILLLCERLRTTEEQLCEVASTQASHSARVTEISRLMHELREEMLEAVANVHFRINSVQFTAERAADRLSAHSVLLETLVFKMALLESRPDDTDSTPWLDTMD